jgi:hypothetical protein
MGRGGYPWVPCGARTGKKVPPQIGRGGGWGWGRDNGAGAGDRIPAPLPSLHLMK